MILTREEVLSERINNGVISRLDVLEARMNLYDDDFENLETNTKCRIFNIEQALRNIDICALSQWARDRQIQEVENLKLRIENLEKEQATQTRYNKIVTQYIRNFGRKFTCLLRCILRLNNNL